MKRHWILLVLMACAPASIKFPDFLETQPTVGDTDTDSDTDTDTDSDTDTGSAATGMTADTALPPGDIRIECSATASTACGEDDCIEMTVVGAVSVHVEGFKPQEITSDHLLGFFEHDGTINFANDGFEPDGTAMFGVVPEDSGVVLFIRNIYDVRGEVDLSVAYVPIGDPYCVVVQDAKGVFYVDASP